MITFYAITNFGVCGSRSYSGRVSRAFSSSDTCGEFSSSDGAFISGSCDVTYSCCDSIRVGLRQSRSMFKLRPRLGNQG